MDNSFMLALCSYCMFEVHSHPFISSNYLHISSANYISVI